MTKYEATEIIISGISRRCRAEMPADIKEELIDNIVCDNMSLEEIQLRTYNAILIYNPDLKLKLKRQLRDQFNKTESLSKLLRIKAILES